MSDLWMGPVAMQPCRRCLKGLGGSNLLPTAVSPGLRAASCIQGQDMQVLRRSLCDG